MLTQQNWKKGSINWWTVFDIEKKERQLQALEKESRKENFWQDHEMAAEISQEISEIKSEIEKIENLKKEVKDLEDLEGIAKTDESLGDELKNKRRDLEEKIRKEEIKTFFSDRYDKNNAILEIFSGAGGIDAQDWATILLRMYQRYCNSKGFETKILHQSFGEGGGPEGRIGTKSAIMEVKGKYAYGFLKKENGVHRLVRISPFNANKLRHTAFASVEIMPELAEEDEKEIEIRPEDLKIETFKSSGPGGQYVNKRESAIRLIHLPTGIAVSSQSERLQGSNRENAMKILKAKLFKFKKEKQQKELKEIKGTRQSVSWGNQIRSYVLHPYKMVKDLRTGVETSNINKVLDGELDDFIEAEIKLKDEK
jgi:peptide chain release factor 2